MRQGASTASCRQRCSGFQPAEAMARDGLLMKRWWSRGRSRDGRRGPSRRQRSCLERPIGNSRRRSRHCHPPGRRYTLSLEPGSASRAQTGQGGSVVVADCARHECRDRHFAKTIDGRAGRIADAVLSNASMDRRPTRRRATVRSNLWAGRRGTNGRHGYLWPRSSIQSEQSRFGDRVLRTHGSGTPIPRGLVGELDVAGACLKESTLVAEGGAR